MYLAAALRFCEESILQGVYRIFSRDVRVFDFKSSSHTLAQAYDTSRTTALARMTDAHCKARRVVNEVEDFVTELQQKHGFVLDHDDQAKIHRRVMGILDVPLCKAWIESKKRLCTYRANKGGYCGKHNKVRQADVQAEVLQKAEQAAVGQSGPAHTSHPFSMFVEDCPGCKWARAFGDS